MSVDEIKVRSVAPDDWPVLQALMGVNGVGGGCWCQWPIVPRGGKLWKSCQGEPNRAAFQREIEAGEVSGCLAFSGHDCVGWGRYGPWESFPRLAHSPSLNHDPPPGTWSIVCFYIPARWRRRGVASTLLDHALARLRGREDVACIEAYPVPPYGEGQVPAAFAWTGTVAMFEQRGFRPSRKTGIKREVYRLMPGPRAG